MDREPPSTSERDKGKPCDHCGHVVLQQHDHWRRSCKSNPNRVTQQPHRPCRYCGQFTLPIARHEIECLQNPNRRAVRGAAPEEWRCKFCNKIRFAKDLQTHEAECASNPNSGRRRRSTRRSLKSVQQPTANRAIAPRPDPLAAYDFANPYGGPFQHVPSGDGGRFDQPFDRPANVPAVSSQQRSGDMHHSANPSGGSYLGQNLQPFNGPSYQYQNLYDETLGGPQYQHPPGRGEFSYPYGHPHGHPHASASGASGAQGQYDTGSLHSNPYGDPYASSSGTSGTRGQHDTGSLHSNPYGDPYASASGTSGTHGQHNIESSHGQQSSYNTYPSGMQPGSYDPALFDPQDESSYGDF